MNNFSTSQVTEEQLLSGIYSGNEEAYRKLFYTYFEPLSFYANKYLNDMDAARDMVQEVMSHIYENRETLRINESLKSFLYRSVSNRSLNVLKHEEVKTRHHTIIRERSDETFDEDLMETSELQAKINRLMDELPDACRQVFIMSRIEEKSNQEIADELNISKRTVETQISKALKVLRNALKIIILEIILKNF